MRNKQNTKDVRDYWANKVGEWSQWADPMAKLAKGMNKPLLNALNIQAGDRVLDLASGVGEPVFSEAQITGDQGLTIATDLVPEMLHALKSRDGSEIMNFSAADMQSLPFADNSFDHVSCRFGIMFVPDQQKSCDECFRVAQSGGKVGFLVWGRKNQQTIFNIIEKSIKDLFAIETDHDFEKIFSLEDEVELAKMLKKSGFDIDKNEQVTFTPVAPEGVNFWQSQLDMSFGHLIKNCTQEELQKLNEKIFEGLLPYKLDTGGYQMNLEVRLVSGKKP